MKQLILVFGLIIMVSSLAYQQIYQWFHIDMTRLRVFVETWYIVLPMFVIGAVIALASEFMTKKR